MPATRSSRPRTFPTSTGPRQSTWKPCPKGWPSRRTRTGWCAAFHEKYASGGYETPEAYADDYLETTRTWSNSTFLAGALPFVGREGAAGMVDELFRRYKCIAQHPADHGMDYVHGYMVLEKEPRG